MIEAYVSMVGFIWSLWHGLTKASTMKPVQSVVHSLTQQLHLLLNAFLRHTSGVHVDLKAVHKITKHDPTPLEVRALCRIPPDRFRQAVHWGLVFELQPQVAIRKLLPMWVLTKLLPETGQGYQHVELVEFYIGCGDKTEVGTYIAFPCFLCGLHAPRYCYCMIYTDTYLYP